MKPETLFHTVYNSLFSDVYAYFSMAFGLDCADDLSQQVFIKLCEYLQKPERKAVENWRAWIFRVAVNVKNDFLRGKYASPEPAEFYDWKEDEGLFPDSAETLVVREALSKLSAADREVLLLKASGLNSGEIGVSLALTASAARSRISRAKERFGKILKECGVELDEENH